MTSAELSANIKKHPLGFLGGLVVIGCLGWIYFRSGDVEQKQAEFDAKSSEAARMTANVRNAEKLPEQVEEIQALAKDATARLVQPAQLAVNLQYFYKLEADTGAKMLDIRQGAVPKSTNKAALYIAVPYTVSLQGSYAQVMQFIQRLESGPHFIRFSSLNFTKATVQGADTQGGLVPDAMNVMINLELLGQP